MCATRGVRGRDAGYVCVGGSLSYLTSRPGMEGGERRYYYMHMLHDWISVEFQPETDRQTARDNPGLSLSLSFLPIMTKSFFLPLPAPHLYVTPFSPPIKTRVYVSSLPCAFFYTTTLFPPLSHFTSTRTLSLSRPASSRVLHCYC